MMLYTGLVTFCASSAHCCCNLALSSLSCALYRNISFMLMHNGACRLPSLLLVSAVAAIWRCLLSAAHLPISFVLMHICMYVTFCSLSACCRCNLLLSSLSCALYRSITISFVTMHIDANSLPFALRVCAVGAACCCLLLAAHSTKTSASVLMPLSM